MLICSVCNWAGAYTLIWATGSAIQQILAAFVAIACFRALFVLEAMPKGFMERFFAPLFLAAILSAASFRALASVHSGWFGAELSALRSISFLLAGAFWILSIVSDRYGIPWRTHTFGIGAGLLFQYTAAVAIDALASFSAPHMMWIASGLGLCTTCVATAVWCAIFKKQEQPLLVVSIQAVQEFELSGNSLKKRVQSIGIDAARRIAR